LHPNGLFSIVNSKFPQIFKGTIAFLYNIIPFFLILFIERTLTFTKASTSFVSQALALDGFYPILEVINKGLEDDDLVMLESSPVANTKNVIEKTMMEKNTKKQRTNFYQQ
jgi:hypothetical protein